MEKRSPLGTSAGGKTHRYHANPDDTPYVRADRHESLREEGDERYNRLGATPIRHNTGRLRLRSRTVLFAIHGQPLHPQ